MTTRFVTVDVNGTDIFYREAGDRGRPSVLLLHGFPSSSHMFRDLIPELAEQYHVIAPDLPGFGQSAMKPRDAFSYTFDNIADVIDRFTEVVGLSRFAIYIFDYGAPVGLRIAARHPERITGIITAERQRLSSTACPTPSIRCRPIGPTPAPPIAQRCAASSAPRPRCFNTPMGSPM